MKGIEDYVNEVIEQLRGFEYGELYKDEPPVMSCPVCNDKVHENLYGYACEHTSADADEATCTFFLRKDYSNSYLTRKGAVDLVATGESPDTTMLFPDGKTFTGKIVLKDDYSVEVLMRTDEGYESIRTKSTKELQELEQCLAEKKLDSEYLAQSGTFKKTDLAYYFEIPAFPKVLGKAPKNQTGKSFVARLPVEVCKRPMTEDEALQFFSNGKTELLTNFISKRGRPFNAKLYVKANGKYGFEFEPRAKKKPAEKSKSKKSE
jgi:DNA topoisomerase-3